MRGTHAPHTLKGHLNMTYTTQKQIRAAFWETFPDLPRRKIKDYSGIGLMYPTDTRCAFAGFIDHLEKSGQIAHDLADRATLER
jgi:hypothetical protein